MASRCCFIISLLLFQIWFRAEAGTIDPRLADYSRVDALMTAPVAGKFRNIDSLSAYISKNFNAEHLRLRAAFRWVTHHIAYSFEYRSMTVQHVFKNRKAVCSGYAELMYELCRRTQVRCRVVNGIAKNDDTFLDAPRESYGHAWNIVTLGGTNYLLDATWAAGYYDTRRHDFTRDFKDSYYLTDPTLFALQHLPDDPADQLLDNPISYKHFEGMPAYTSQAVSLKIREMSPSTGELKSRRSDIIPFSIQADAPIENVVIGYRQPGSWYMKYHYPEIKQDGATSSFSVAIEEPGQYIMTVFVNHAGALYYKVKVGWK